MKEKFSGPAVFSTDEELEVTLAFLQAILELDETFYGTLQNYLPTLVYWFRDRFAMESVSKFLSQFLGIFDQGV